MTTIPPRQQQELLVVDRQEARGAILIRPTGEVDLTTVPILWSNLKALLEDGQHVVVDLSAIRYIDSTGFEALLDCGTSSFSGGSVSCWRNQRASSRDSLISFASTRSSPSSRLSRRRWTLFGTQVDILPRVVKYAIDHTPSVGRQTPKSHQYSED